MSRPLRPRVSGSGLAFVQPRSQSSGHFFRRWGSQPLPRDPGEDGSALWVAGQTPPAQMTNHYHLLVETPQTNLSAGMRDLDRDYAQAVNKRHRRIGHLFRSRFRDTPVEKESHLPRAYPLRSPQPGAREARSTARAHGPGAAIAPQPSRAVPGKICRAVCISEPSSSGRDFALWWDPRSSQPEYPRARRLRTAVEASVPPTDAEVE